VAKQNTAKISVLFTDNVYRVFVITLNVDYVGDIINMSLVLLNNPQLHGHEGGKSPTCKHKKNPFPSDKASIPK